MLDVSFLMFLDRKIPCQRTNAGEQDDEAEH